MHCLRDGVVKMLVAVVIRKIHHDVRRRRDGTDHLDIEHHLDVVAGIPLRVVGWIVVRNRCDAIDVNGRNRCSCSPRLLDVGVKVLVQLALIECPTELDDGNGLAGAVTLWKVVQGRYGLRWVPGRSDGGSRAPPMWMIDRPIV